MRVEEGRPKFKEVVITLESQEEVDALWTLVNHSAINHSLDGTGNNTIPTLWNKLSSLHSDDYDELHVVLNNKLRNWNWSKL